MPVEPLGCPRNRFYRWGMPLGKFRRNAHADARVLRAQRTASDQVCRADHSGCESWGTPDRNAAVGWRAQLIRARHPTPAYRPATCQGFADARLRLPLTRLYAFASGRRRTGQRFVRQFAKGLDKLLLIEGARKWPTPTALP